MYRPPYNQSTPVTAAFASTPLPFTRRPPPDPTSSPRSSTSPPLPPSLSCLGRIIHAPTPTRRYSACRHSRHRNIVILSAVDHEVIRSAACAVHRKCSRTERVAVGRNARQRQRQHYRILRSNRQRHHLYLPDRSAVHRRFHLNRIHFGG